MPVESESKKLDPEDPIEMYCGVISAFGETILDGRDRGMKMNKTKDEMLKLKPVSKSVKLQEKVEELIDFIYVTAPDTPREKLSDFILNDWCLGQLK